MIKERRIGLYSDKKQKKGGKKHENKLKSKKYGKKGVCYPVGIIGDNTIDDVSKDA